MQMGGYMIDGSCGERIDSQTEQSLAIAASTYRRRWHLRGRVRGGKGRLFRDRLLRNRCVHGIGHKLKDRVPFLSLHGGGRGERWNRAVESRLSATQEADQEGSRAQDVRDKSCEGVGYQLAGARF